MVGRSKLSRRQAEDSDSDSDAGGPSLPAEESKNNNALEQLTYDDLGNAARDRQTAHDKEQDRFHDEQRLNRMRRCNQEWQPESEVAAANIQKLKGWSSMGDESAGLGNIANGQYHRINMTREIEQVRRRAYEEGVELNIDQIDSHVPHHRVNLGPSDRGRGRGRGPGPLIGRQHGRSDRPLDPAVDPNRQYTYKGGPKYSSGTSAPARGQPSTRGGHTMPRGGHSSMHSSRPLLNVQNPPATHAPGQDLPKSPSTRVAGRGGGLVGRAAAQRQTKNQVWLPEALADHMPEITARQEALKSPMTNTGIISPVVASTIESVAATTSICGPSDNLVPVTSQQGTSVPGRRSQPKSSLRQQLDDPASFFAIVASTAIVPAKQNKTAPPVQSGLHLPNVASSQKEQTLIDCVQTDEIIVTKPAAPKDDHTDGHPTPSALTGFTPSPSIATTKPSSPIATTEPSQAVATTEPSSAVVGLGIGSNHDETIPQKPSKNSEASQSLPILDLLTKDEGGVIKQEALNPCKSPEEVIIFDGRMYRPAPTDFTPEMLSPTATIIKVINSQVIIRPEKSVAEHTTKTMPPLAADRAKSQNPDPKPPNPTLTAFAQAQQAAIMDRMRIAAQEAQQEEEDKKKSATANVSSPATSAAAVRSPQVLKEKTKNVRANVPAVKNSLLGSKYATPAGILEGKSAPAGTHASKWAAAATGISRTGAGDGFQQMVASMTASGMVPNPNRNPGEPAWIPAPTGPL